MKSNLTITLNQNIVVLENNPHTVTENDFHYICKPNQITTVIENNIHTITKNDFSLQIKIN